MLRCKVTQRQSLRTESEVIKYNQKEFLTKEIEISLCRLLYDEILLHSEKAALVDRLFHTHDFTITKAFNAIDDWRYQYIDNNNLKRFLIGMGYTTKKGDGFNMKKLTNGIIRRFDLNGDGKLSF